MRGKGIVTWTTTVIVILFISKIIINSLHHVEFVCYNKEDNTISLNGDNANILEDVVSPAWSENYILAIIYDGEDEFIGKYVMEEGAWENLMSVSWFYKETGRQIERSLFSNFRLSNDRKLTFVYDDGIYEYDITRKEIHLIKACDGVSRFEWVDKETLLILDETSNLLIGWLKKYNIQTEEEFIIDKSVTDFIYLEEDNQIVYAKKYFLGSWCEYELKYVNAYNLNLISNKRYANTSIGQIILDVENNIFVVESCLSSDNELEVKKILKGSLNAIYVGKVNRYCIGIK